MRVTHVKSARKAVPSANIAVGDSYYWWKFRYGGKRYSKTYPKRSQLTQSGFLSQLYDLQDRISEAPSFDDASAADDFRNELVSEIESLRDECQSSFDNIPEQLQEASAGSILTERIEALDEWISELEGIDCDIDEDELREDAKNELYDNRDTSEEVDEDGEEKEIDIDEWAEQHPNEIDSLYEEKLSEKLEEILDEIKGCEVSL